MTGSGEDPRERALARLRKIAAQLRQAEGEPELIEAARLLDRVAAGELAISEALGLSVGGEPFEVWARRRRRDQCYRELRAVVCPNETVHAAARRIFALVSYYAATGWPHDRRTGAPPAGANREREVLFRLLRAGDALRLRQLQQVLEGAGLSAPCEGLQSEALPTANITATSERRTKSGKSIP